MAMTNVYRSEYYFSVDNLCRDIYFRMQWDNEGYVPISFIAEFNRVKSIGANIYQIREVGRSGYY